MISSPAASRSCVSISHLTNNVLVIDYDWETDSILLMLLFVLCLEIGHVRMFVVLGSVLVGQVHFSGL